MTSKIVKLFKDLIDSNEKERKPKDKPTLPSSGYLVPKKTQTNMLDAAGDIRIPKKKKKKD